MRIEAASREPAMFFERWAEADARAQQEQRRGVEYRASLDADANVT